VDRALASGRQSWPQQVLAAVLARLGRVVIEPVPSAQVSAYVSDQISRDVDRAPVDATVTVASGTPQITGGTAGLYLLRHSLAGCLSQAMAARAPRPFAIGTVTVPPAISEEDLEPTLTQVHQLIDAPVTLRFAGLDVRLQAADLGRLIRVAGPAPRPGPVDVQSAPVVAAVDEASLNDYVTHTLGPEVDQPPRDATFIANGDSVQVVPSADGRQVDQAQLAQRLESALEGGPRTVDIPTEVAHPAFTTEQAQALGISARIASGVSHFAGSSPERKNNVRVAAAHINGAVIKPGDTFSFNSEVGDISLATGFLEGLIISGGRTVPGVGGGVCQVSTTVFRAALNAGLPIVERHAHAYRVGWYEQGGFPPGLDATVFTGVDLRFRNDSDAAMVLMTEYDPAGTLTVTLWGSHALNRAVTLSDPAISNVTPHPEDEYVLDSSLAPGTTQQVDYAHDGMDVSFTRSVSQGGQPLFSDTFSSHYQAWRNIFLYNPASPSPATQSPAPSPGQ
jgi:vancomycin resistance protein YoaR